jgi:hypothetical protein
MSGLTICKNFVNDIEQYLIEKQLTNENTFKQALATYKAPSPAALTTQEAIDACALQKAMIFIETLFTYVDNNERVWLTDPVLSGLEGNRIFIDFIMETSSTTRPSWGTKKRNFAQSDLPDPILSEKLGTFYKALHTYVHEANLNDPHQALLGDWLENSLVDLDTDSDTSLGIN